MKAVIKEVGDEYFYIQFFDSSGQLCDFCIVEEIIYADEKGGIK